MATDATAVAYALLRRSMYELDLAIARVTDPEQREALRSALRYERKAEDAIAAALGLMTP